MKFHQEFLVSADGTIFSFRYRSSPVSVLSLWKLSVKPLSPGGCLENNGKKDLDQNFIIGAYVFGYFHGHQK